MSILNRFSHSEPSSRTVWIAAAVVAITTFGALQIPAAHDPAIKLLLLGVTTATLIASAASVRSASRVVVFVSLAVTSLTLLVAVALEGTAFTREPLAKATLTRSHPDATLSLPSDAHELIFEARASLHGRNAQGTYGVDLQRDGTTTEVRGALAHYAPSKVRIGRKRVKARSAGGNASELQPLTLAGQGPVRAHLAFVHGSLAPVVHLAFLPVPAWTRWAMLTLAAMVALAIVVQIGAVREGLKTQFAAGVSLVALMALSLIRSYDGAATTRSAVHAGLAGLVGAGAAMAITWVATRLFTKREAPSEPAGPRATSG